MVIDHPAGEECQWDWLELRDTPWGSKVFVLVGVLSHSGRFRAWISSSQDQAHLVEGIDGVLRRFGGTARRWRVDRMATVLVPGTDRIQASFVGVAKHYGVGVDPCPPRRPNRKGVVEKAIHYIAQRWWRTAAVGTLSEAQDSLDHFSETVGDARRRAGTRWGTRRGEPLLDLPPMPYPAEGVLVRKVAANGLVSVWGNQYSVPPGVIRTEVSVRWRLGDPSFDVISASGRLVATHRKVPRGQGRVVRLPEHTAALEKVVLGAFTTARPPKPKPNRPPSQAARAIAADIGGGATQRGEPVIDLAVYPTSHRPTEPAPAMSRDTVYQQLRGHLAYLKLTAAAEALPAHLGSSPPEPAWPHPVPRRVASRRGRSHRNAPLEQPDAVR